MPPKRINWSSKYTKKEPKGSFLFAFFYLHKKTTAEAVVFLGFTLCLYPLSVQGNVTGEFSVPVVQLSTVDVGCPTCEDKAFLGGSLGQNDHLSFFHSLRIVQLCTNRLKGNGVLLRAVKSNCNRNDSGCLFPALVFLGLSILCRQNNVLKYNSREGLVFGYKRTSTVMPANKLVARGSSSYGRGEGIAFVNLKGKLSCIIGYENRKNIAPSRNKYEAGSDLYRRR